MKKHTPLFVITILAVLLVLLLSGCAGRAAPTQRAQPTRDTTFEKKNEQQLQQMNPDAVPIYQNATKALDANDATTSKKLYEQVIALAPTFSTAYRRLGYIEADQNNLAQAEALTRKALELEPNGYNQSALASILLQKGTPADTQEAFKLATTAAEALPDDEQAQVVLLMSAAAQRDIPVMRTADKRLLEISPDNPVAHYFAGAVATEDGRWEDAEAEFIYAGQLGMPAEATKNVLDAIAFQVFLVRFLRWGAIGTVLWLIGLGFLFIAGTFLSRATIKALNQPQAAAGVPIQPEEQRLRSIYRTLINVLGLYFYISIPFVLLALLLLVGGAFYIFLLIGSIPIQFSVILVIMLFASLFAMARALFSRTRDIAPGRELSKRDAPDLWRLVEDVAKKLGTRPIDTIYLTPGTDMAVTEKGGVLQKMRGAGRRNLILGMGMLSALNQGQLSSVLAHEYGHFSNQDTAGGEMAYHVYAALEQLAQRLIQGRVAYIFNPVWLFVFTYQRIFLRVTLGASRLQEVLADRYAAIAYGSQNFVDGLRSVIRQGLFFPAQANYEIRRAIDLKHPVYNLYTLQSESANSNLQSDLDKQLEEQMTRSTSEYDSHPAPQQRIAWVERLNIPYHSIDDSSRPALELLPNPEDLQRELTSQVMKNIRS